MFTLTTVKYNQNTRFVADSYKNSSKNFFEAAKKPQKQYKTMNQLLKECPLLGGTLHGTNFIA